MSGGRHSHAVVSRLAHASAGARSARNRARIFLLSDVRLYREGLLWSLSRQEAFEVIGAGDLSSHTLATLVELKPEVVILDVGAAEGFAMAKTLSSRQPDTKIVAFAVSEVDHVVLACAEAGIAGYVAPNGSEEDLISAVEFALRGELYCSPRIAHLLFRRIGALSARLAGSPEPESLTHRERQILDLVGEGRSNKEIGRALRISNATVKNHVHNILEKLQVHRRGEAAARLRAVLVPVPVPDGHGGSAARRPSSPLR
jgi:DNA-binding NarL/FixJ family response regulator